MQVLQVHAQVNLNGEILITLTYVKWKLRCLKALRSRSCSCLKFLHFVNQFVILDLEKMLILIILISYFVSATEFKWDRWSTVLFLCQCKIVYLIWNNTQNVVKDRVGSVYNATVHPGTSFTHPVWADYLLLMTLVVWQKLVFRFC